MYVVYFFYLRTAVRKMNVDVQTPPEIKSRCISPKMFALFVASLPSSIPRKSGPDKNYEIAGRLS